MCITVDNSVDMCIKDTDLSYKCLFLTLNLRYSEKTMQKLSHLDIGQIGEEATAKHYKKQGYKIVAMNYRKTFGEIDVIAQKADMLVFVEVKSVSCVTFDSVSRDTFNPAENIHYKKQARLRKTIAAFLSENPKKSSSWRFDVAIVQVNTELRRSRMEIVEDVIL